MFYVGTGLLVAVATAAIIGALTHAPTFVYPFLIGIGILGFVLQMIGLWKNRPRN